MILLNIEVQSHPGVFFIFYLFMFHFVNMEKPSSKLSCDPCFHDTCSIKKFSDMARKKACMMVQLLRWFLQFSKASLHLCLLGGTGNMLKHHWKLVIITK